MSDVPRIGIGANPMKLWQILLAVAFLVGMTALLAACGDINTDGDGQVTDGDWYTERTAEYDVRLKDGRTITCIQTYGYGISCDWDGAK